MNLVYLLKLCVVGTLVGTLFTSILFMMRSSDEQQIKAHVKDLYAKISRDDRQQQQPETGNEVAPDAGDAHRHAEEPAVQPVEKAANAPAPPETAVIAAPEPATVEPAVLKELKEVKSSRAPSVHIFYYPWYGSPAFNGGAYYHWNHEILKPWNPSDKHRYPTGRHHPPEDIASVYYPALGPYSSWDPAVIEKHMKWISSAGIDVLVVSWYPKGKADEQGRPWDALIPLLLNATERFKLKLSFHLEPYASRTVDSVREDIQYLLESYGAHPAFYRTTPKVPRPAASTGGGADEAAKAPAPAPAPAELPLFYVYDSYLIGVEEWQRLTMEEGGSTIRHTKLDSLLIGLCVNAGDAEKLQRAGFDGLYTYFAADGFSHGSTMANWPQLSTFAAKAGMLFVPSVGPGYDDSRVRPWNANNTHARNGGAYYQQHFEMAHTARADIVSITSFNEWHEGTQIEPAVPYPPAPPTAANETAPPKFTYAQYEKGADQYLQLTLASIQKLFTPHQDNIPMQIARIV